MWGERKNADGHADGGADRPLLKVMTSRRQVTDIWVLVAAVALSAHFHHIQPRRESTQPHLRLPSLGVSQIHGVVVYTRV